MVKVTAHFRARDLQLIHIAGEGGLEPPRPEGHWHLKPARLPFRHSPQQPGSLSLDAPRSPTVPIRPRRPPPVPRRFSEFCWSRIRVLARYHDVTGVAHDTRVAGHLIGN